MTGILLSGQQQPRALAPLAAATPSTVPTPMPGETILVMGTDATSDGGRGGMRGNTDTMMLVRTVPGDPADGHPAPELAVFSVPRDTRLHIDGHGKFKVNACVPYGGPQLAIQTVSRYLALPIDHYVLLNLDAVIELANAVGGVDITVPKRLNYDDYSGNLHIHLTPGIHHMQGQELEAYLRFRHDEIGDIGRIGRQQGMVRELMRELLTPGNLLRAPQFWGILRRNVETDLSLGDLVHLALFVHGLDLDHDVRMSMLPGYPRNIGGVSYWIGDRQAAESFLDHYFRGLNASAAPLAGDLTVTVWDGAQLPYRVRRRAEAEIRAAGFRIVDVVPVPDDLPHPTTEVITERGDVQDAKRLSQAIGGGRVLVAAQGEYDTDFTVLLGHDRR